jgi:hypothetical protein
MITYSYVKNHQQTIANINFNSNIFLSLYILITNILPLEYSVTYFSQRAFV